jgi:hypothetical protein
MGVNLHALHVSFLVSPIQHTRFGFWLGMVVVGVEYNAWIATNDAVLPLISSKYSAATTYWWSFF